MADTPEREFAQAIDGRDHEVDLFGGAVAIARLGRDRVDAHGLARELDLIAEAVRERSGERARPDDLAAAISAELFERRGFRGNRERYTDPENSYIDRVIKRRFGIPITLSLVYMEIAQRLGLECDGIGFPRALPRSLWWHRRLLRRPLQRPGNGPTREDLRRRLDGRAGTEPSLDSFLAAVTRRQILQRMLLNLCAAYQGAGDAARWIAALGFRLCLEPWNAALYLERGLLHYQQGSEELALADLERYV